MSNDYFGYDRVTEAPPRRTPGQEFVGKLSMRFVEIVQEELAKLPEDEVKALGVRTQYEQKVHQNADGTFTGSDLAFTLSSAPIVAQFHFTSDISPQL